jgi:flagellar biosynthesis protein FlhA
LLLPVAAAGLIAVLLVPLPPGLMNVLLVANLALSAIILLTTIAVARPLEFSALPSVLLGTTLLRMVLNVALTRLILTAGQAGADPEQARYAAGTVVWAFSDFVARGSLTVGLVIFAILIVIQFVVVTKGSTRISEVAARFALDAMPGKQMAIDADLAAKVITPAQAQHRRAEVAREADFYGAMDGASKFLRGEAVAAVLIMLVNLLGGIYMGLVQYGWDLSQTVGLFSRLTIGDGLVTQIPAFIVTLASALIVTRSAARSNLSEQVATQLISRPAVLLTTAGFLALLALASLPALPLVLIGGGLVAIAAVVSRQAGGSDDAQEYRLQAGEGMSDEEGQSNPPSPQADNAPAAGAPAASSVDDLLRVDPIRIELGYALVRLADRSGLPGERPLLEHVEEVRRQIAADLGLLVPAVRVKDNLQLGAHEYVIKIRGAKVAQGRAYAGEFLAVAEESLLGRLKGRSVAEPVHGQAAMWVDPDQAANLQAHGLKVAGAEELLAEHLASVIRRHAWELLSRQQVATMVAELSSRCNALVTEVTARFKIGTIQKVLQNLLREEVPIHDLETILEAASDWPGDSEDVHFLGEHVRGSLARTLSQRYCSSDGHLWCVSLAPELEEEIRRHMDEAAPTGQAPEAVAMDPELSRRVADSLNEGLECLNRQGHRGVVLCSPALRQAVRQLVAPACGERGRAPRVEAAVLAYNEVDSVEVRTLNFVEREP